MAITPATKATTIVLRLPTSSWDSTSCWTWVVPSRCAADGACGTPFVVDRLADGLKGASSGPTIASRMKTIRMPRPISSFGERGSWSLPRETTGTGASGASGGAVPLTTVIGQASCRMRGSRKMYTQSAMRFAASTAKVMIRKIPCSSG